MHCQSSTYSLSAKLTLCVHGKYSIYFVYLIYLFILVRVYLMTLSVPQSTFQCLALTLPTTNTNIQKLYVVLTLHYTVLYGSQNKQNLLPYTALTD
jgi:hypothetical protein